MAKVSLKNLYQNYKNTGDIPSPLSNNILSEAIETNLKSKGFDLYNGKVRKCLTKNDAFYFYHTDQLSAFDRYIGEVPFKGSILAAITRFWMENLSDIVPTHYESMVGERVLKVKKLTPFKAEVIVRGYLAGSMMRAYNKGVRDFCGNTLPEGLTDFGALPESIITPTSKAEAFEHDEETSAAQLISDQIVSDKEWEQISKMAIDIFQRGSEVFKDRGWILVDTKYEFGRDENGKIYLMDEAHTPDSSRLWVASSYQDRIANATSPEMLDKEIIRRELMEKGFSGQGDVPKVSNESLVSLGEVYLEVLEKLIGEEFTIDTDRNFPDLG